MELSQFYEHHGLRPDACPFDNDDDAKKDTIFGDIIDISRHHDWNRMFGSAGVPSTAVIFGRKGTGKTALRLQMRRILQEYNQGRKQGRVLLIDYADFDPFISAFQTHQGGEEKVFAYWRMSDHLDAILSLAVTRHVTELLGGDLDRKTFTPARRRMLVFLTLMYDRDLRDGQLDRWQQLARKLGCFTVFNAFQRHWDELFKVGGLRVGLDSLFGVVVAGGIIYLSWLLEQPLVLIAAPVLFTLACLPGFIKRRRRKAVARRILESTAVLPAGPRVLETLYTGLRQLAGTDFRALELPLVYEDSARQDARVADNRYAYLKAFQEIVGVTGYSGVLVIVDQVDEPSLMEGNAKRMWAFIRSMMDNKLLQHPGLGIKFLLLEELYERYEKEESEFRAKARLDKQNLVKSLKWSGANLMDLANRRLAACALHPEQPVRVEMLFDESLHGRLLHAFERWESPRDLFKFLDTAIKNHINRYTDHEPAWTISEASLETAELKVREIRSHML